MGTTGADGVTVTATITTCGARRLQAGAQTDYQLKYSDQTQANDMKARIEDPATNAQFTGKLVEELNKQDPSYAFSTEDIAISTEVAVTKETTDDPVDPVDPGTGGGDPDEPEEPTEDPGSDNTAAIVGGAIGGVIGLVGVIAGCWWYNKKKKEEGAAPQGAQG